MRKIFLIDNYDSFTYNLLYYLEELGCEVTVKRNDKFDLNEINNFDAILISPGPGIPKEAGKIIEVINNGISAAIGAACITIKIGDTSQSNLSLKPIQIPREIPKIAEIIIPTTSGFNVSA